MRLKFMATGILVERRSHAAAMLALLILLTLGVGCFAAEIRKGATMQVKPDSIWFEDAAKLTRWRNEEIPQHPGCPMRSALAAGDSI